MTTRNHRPLLVAAVATAAAVSPVLVGTATAGAASTVQVRSARPVTTTTVRPAALPRGADVAVPHVEGSAVVDGAVRIPVAADRVTLLGRTGSDYVVATGDGQGARGRVYRIAPDGSSTLLARTQLGTATLSDDGGTLVGYRVTGGNRTRVTAWSTSTGDQVGQRVLPGFVSPLASRGRRVVLGSFEPSRTLTWSVRPDRLRVLSRQAGYAADLTADVLARFDGDPYDGGCTMVTRLSTGAVLWRSCTERVDAISPDGRRITTIDKLTDGIGASQVWARTVRGRLVGRYDVRQGYFGPTSFETDTAALLPTVGPRRTAVVRCTGAVCERASDLTPSEPADQAPTSSRSSG